jgi:formylmethanofuran dehydrogenase subunit A
LLVNDPWRIAMSTDHPNGGSFLAYPQIIRLLMDRGYREECIARAHPAVRERGVLADLGREYTLNEICIITRAGPARMLGLANKGHLGVGADADVTIYTPSANWETMFELPRYVIKAGELIVEEGDIRDPVDGRTLYVQPDYDRGSEADIADWFDEFYSIRFGNYPVPVEYLHESESVPCGQR